MDETVPIKYSDPSQEVAALQQIAADLAKVLTSNEEIFYVALQNQMAVTLVKDCVVATSNRVLIYNAQLLGRVDFVDILWQDVLNTSIEQGTFSSRFSVETTDGRQAGLGELDKDQAKRLYSICQQMEQEWREKRRIREMEEARARAGGIYMSAPSGPPASQPDDPVAKLARAKAMLDQGLISETEYDTLKARILSEM